MRYKYRNDKHVKLHGMLPGEEKVFDHRIEGGGITLIEEIQNKKEYKKDSLEDD